MRFTRRFGLAALSASLLPVPGNSDGGLQILQWTIAGSGARFAGIVHHTDAAREYAYDRQSKIGKLDKAWDEAKAKGWTVVDMKQDLKEDFGFEPQSAVARCALRKV